jgi:hypothetical protein
MGLLSRANTLDEKKSNPGLSFSDFIHKHSLKICALLEKKDNDYFVVNSIGFDAASIFSAVATSDFWDGICSNSGKIYSFKDSEKTKLLQLFSLNLKENISELSVYKNSSSKILLCAGTIDNQISSDFENIANQLHENDIYKLNPLIKEGSVVLFFKIDFSMAIKAFYDSEKNPNIPFEFFQKTIMNELYNRFCCRYNIADTALIINSDSIKTVFITNKEYSVELITHHIKINLKEVLSNYAEDILICFSGTADSCDKIKSFLQAE